ncbi:MAG: hypothetical protein M3R70_03400 [Actinomycetota bacterium]|nr:hypothetical protein [Actinomycetota bacterium]
MWTYLIPIYILGGLLLLVGAFALLSRIKGGRYARPVVQVLLKVPFLGKLLRRASTAALERQNPELASAVKKLERAGVTKDPQRAQQALSRLNASERKAYLEAASEQEAFPEPMNREQRRRMERMRKNR